MLIIILCLLSTVISLLENQRLFGGGGAYVIAGNALMAAVKQYKKMKEAGLSSDIAMGEAAFPESSKDLGRIGFPHAMYTFVAQAVKLRVDPITGSVSLLDIAAATECGKVINPLGLAGQIQCFHGIIGLGLVNQLNAFLIFIPGSFPAGIMFITIFSRTFCSACNFDRQKRSGSFDFKIGLFTSGKCKLHLDEIFFDLDIHP